MQVFHFAWESYDWAEMVSGKLDKSTHVLNKPDCYGLYYITGSHFIYGQNTLLYLGKAQEQRFGYRLSQHEDFNVTNITNIHRLYIGKLLKRDSANEENWGDVIDLSEKLLINSMIPAMNSTHIKWVLDENTYGDILICNWNDIGFLLPEVSGYRFSNKYWDTTKYPENALSE